MIPNSTGHELGVNPWISTQIEQYFLPGRIWPVEFDRAWNIAKNGSKFIGMIPNSTGHELGVNPWISTQIEQYFMPGRIWNSTGQEILLKLGVNPWISTQFEPWIYSQFDRARNTAQFGCKSMNFNPIWAMDLLPIRPVEFDRARNTAQIGSKSSWIHWDDTQFDQGGIQMLSQWIYSHFEQYFLPGQIWNSTGRIRPGKKYCSNWE